MKLERWTITGADVAGQMIRLGDAVTIASQGLERFARVVHVAVDRCVLEVEAIRFPLWHAILQELRAAWYTVRYRWRTIARPQDYGESIFDRKPLWWAHPLEACDPLVWRCCPLAGGRRVRGDVFTGKTLRIYGRNPLDDYGMGDWIR